MASPDAMGEVEVTHDGYNSVTQPLSAQQVNEPTVCSHESELVDGRSDLRPNFRNGCADGEEDE
jgi:hypothetical protein